VDAGVRERFGQFGLFAAEIPLHKPEVLDIRSEIRRRMIANIPVSAWVGNSAP